MGVDRGAKSFALGCISIEYPGARALSYLILSGTPF